MSKGKLIYREWDSLSYDFGSSASSPSDLSPEEKLFFAVIMQAVEDATSPKVTPVVRDKARTVIFTPSATALKDMCLFLNIDYDYFQEGVAKMIKEGRTLVRTIT